MSKVKIQGHASGTGVFTLTSPNSSTDRTITLPDGSGTLAFTTGDDDKLPLAGGTMTGNLIFADNVRARFGASNDLQIFHDTNNSYIENTGTGDLIIQDSGGDVRIKGKSNEDSIVANNDGSVDLYHDNTKKFETTATGFKLTGTAGTSPLLELTNGDSEDNDTGRESTLRFTGKRSGGEATTNAQISGHHDGSADDNKGMILFSTNDGSNNAERMRIDSSGNVGIGVTSGNRTLAIGTLGTKTDTTTKYVMNIAQTTEASNYAGLGVYFVGHANAASRKWQFQPTENGVANDGIIEMNPNGGYFRANRGVLFNTDTAAANILDDYEEGTWTINTSNLTTHGTIAITGTYTKIGNVVTVTAHQSQGQLSRSGTGGHLTGLPFNPKANTSATSIMSDGSPTQSVGIVVYGNGDYIYLAGAYSQDNIMFSVTYIV